VPDAAIGALLLAVAVALAVCGVVWLALAMDTHWQQVRDGSAPTRGAATALRWLGSLALFASLLLCLRADHLTMAPLVWLMSIAGAAVLVALMLAWRPRWLAPWVSWLPPRRAH
jgi:hypothetical protein